MRILLPPSEGKDVPSARTSRRLEIGSLSIPALQAARTVLIEHLVALCRDEPDLARKALGLSVHQSEQVQMNADLMGLPAAPASRIFTGVLFQALDLPSLAGQDLRRANRRVLISSGLYGLVHPTDVIAPYRLPGDVSLPGIGPLTKFWRPPMAVALTDIVGKGMLLVDMRSSTYVQLGPLTGPLARNAVTVKIWQAGSGGQRTAVSHANKESKGQIARLLASAPERPTVPADLVDLLRDHGWDAELALATRPEVPHRLDVTLPAK